MKKALSIFLVPVFTIAMLTGCASTKPTTNNQSPNTPSSESNIAKIGLGHVTSINSSKDLGVDKDGKEVLPTAQVDTVMVAAAFDKDGKVVKVTIDNAQSKVDFEKDLKLKSNINEKLKTKVELGDAYGMVKGSQIKKEWYQQIAELEKWMKGKTVDEIKNMKVKKKDDAHPSVPEVAELTSLVTITVQDYIAALEEAYKTAVEIKGAAVKVGLGHDVSIANSKALGVDKDGKEVLPVGQVDTVMVASAFDKDGKVVGVIIDNAQTKVQYGKDGKVTSDKKAPQKTKVELGDAYGMVKGSQIKKEWYQQIAELQKWMNGKTVDQIKAMKVKKKDDGHPSVPDVAELTSLVTVTVQDYIAGVAEAYANAK